MIQTQQGYYPKDLHFNDTGRKKLVSGISKMAAAVKSTMGPGGNTVFIESPNHTGGMTVTRDGVTVAKAIDLVDPVENLAVRLMKEASDKTATVAGDGTTTAIVLTESMILSGTDMITSELNRTEVLRSMVDISDKVVENLRRRAKKMTNQMLFDVATISANNDRFIGRLIADVYKQVGRNGIVTVERSQSGETYSETTTGLKIDRGYTSPLFANDQRKDECVFDDVMVLVADVEISNILQIENILKPVISENKQLLIIAPCNSNVINTLAANVMKGNLKVCVIPPPNFGYKQHELMQDLAISVGAKYFSEKTGDDLSLINFGDLGHATRIVSSKDKTLLIRSDHRSKQSVIDERVAQLKAAVEMANKKSEKDFLFERIASLTGGVGVIFVGGNTDTEQKELYDRVDDAVCAVRSALDEGVLPGAGKALYEVNLDEMFDIVSSRHFAEWECATKIMETAFKAPLRQILQNVGLTDSMYIGADIPAGHGLNIKTGELGDLISMGVVDPLKVTRSALQNAVSVATTILSTNAIVTMARVYEQSTNNPQL